MHDQPPPLMAGVFMLFAAILFGLIALFTDQYFDWSIRSLQSPLVRRVYRILTALMALVALAFATWTLAHYVKL